MAIERFYEEVEDLLANGVELPKPPPVLKAEFSGRFTVRVSSFLHEQLKEHADRNKVSLSAYAGEVLAKHEMLYAITKAPSICYEGASEISTVLKLDAKAKNSWLIDQDAAVIA